MQLQSLKTKKLKKLIQAPVILTIIFTAVLGLPASKVNAIAGVEHPNAKVITPTVSSPPVTVNPPSSPMPKTSNPPPHSAQLTQGALPNGKWLLRSVGSIARVLSTVDIEFKDQRVMGSDGCNRFTGGYESLAAGQLRFKTEAIASTRMACFGEGDLISRAFDEVLKNTTGYAFVDGDLHLRDRHGKVLAAYYPSATGLLGTRWKIDGLNDGREALYSAANLDRLELTFLHAAQFIGRVGCVALSGRYLIDESKGTLGMSHVKTDHADCHRSHTPTKEHTELLNALKKIHHYQRTGGSLVCRSAEGAMQITAHLKGL